MFEISLAVAIVAKLLNFIAETVIQDKTRQG
jgi:hypothetical protein